MYTQTQENEYKYNSPLWLFPYQAWHRGDPEAKVRQGLHGRPGTHFHDQLKGFPLGSATNTTVQEEVLKPTQLGTYVIININRNRMELS